MTLWDYTESASLFRDMESGMPRALGNGGLNLVGASPDEDGSVALPKLSQLGHWEQTEEQLRYKVAASMNLPVAEVDASTQSSVLLREFRRYTERDIGDEIVEYGVALRVVITVSGADVSGTLTLPSIAAKAELGYLKASARIGVVGVTGNEIFGLFPAFSELTVESYVKYVAATDAIKEYLSKNPVKLRPEELRRRKKPIASAENQASLWYAVGVVRAIRYIADGRTQDAALGDVRSYDSIASGVNDAYSALLPGEGSNVLPNSHTRAQASHLENYI